MGNHPLMGFNGILWGFTRISSDLMGFNGIQWCSMVKPHNHLDMIGIYTKTVILIGKVMMNISSWHLRIGVFMYTRGSGKTWFMYGAHLSSYQKNTKNTPMFHFQILPGRGSLHEELPMVIWKFPCKCCHTHQNISKCKHHLPCSWAHPVPLSRYW